jgi:hypothetical protein
MMWEIMNVMLAIMSDVYGFNRPTSRASKEAPIKFVIGGSFCKQGKQENQCFWSTITILFLLYGVGMPFLGMCFLVIGQPGCVFFKWE